MSQLLFPAELGPVLEELRNASGSIKWVVLVYEEGEKDRLTLKASGSGAVDEFVASFSDDQVAYGLLSLKVDDAFSNRYKNALVVWSGEKSHWMVRGQVTAHKAQVETFFKGIYHVILPATSKDDLTEELIRKSLKKASGADYDAGGKDQTTAESSSVAETDEAAAKSQFTKPERPGRGGRQLIRKAAS